MSPTQRAREILAALRESGGELTVEQACERLGVSAATVRRDFTALAATGEVEKTWGGIAPRAARRDGMTPSRYRESLFPEEKARIGARAAGLCADGDIVFIDGGTTTLQLARWLANRDVRIVTNSLLVARELDRYRTAPDGAEVFLTGGYLYPGSGLLVGPEAVASVRGYHANAVFLSAGGLGSDGATNNHHLVVEVERVMIERAERVFLLADHSKFGRREMIPECSLAVLDALVTDAAPAQDLKRALRAAGVAVHIAGA